MNRLIVVDMQNDFISDEMRSNGLVDRVVARINKSIDANEYIYLTMDKHIPEEYEQFEESKFFPLHCEANTNGYFLIPEVGEAIAVYRKRTIVEKNTFACLDLLRYLAIDLKEGDTLELIGVCSDICVLNNALMLRANLPTVPIAVNLTCCAGTSVEAQKAVRTILPQNAISVIGV